MFDGNTKAFETKPDVFSLEGLIAWLEQKPPKERYDLSRSQLCLLGQYTTSCGGYYDPATISYRVPGAFMSADLAKMPKVLAKVAHDETDDRAYTFGDALARAKALLASR